eukprot:CAMPEP_0119342914 /NCGR_PEP_ID=MMETSP1333-20130426/105754_1 /TAXON_ID=418940 /ORGANISM="Scyphosphaera apsteinii, Strain RCC1455" /LENGTH=51 /DNA_ID=CAMNT_0007355237 /DNA_START=50 /DNA_END=201 /DNA_ORIENTATION=+
MHYNTHKEPRSPASQSVRSLACMKRNFAQRLQRSLKVPSKSVLPLLPDMAR